MQEEKQGTGYESLQKGSKELGKKVCKKSSKELDTNNASNRARK